MKIERRSLILVAALFLTACVTPPERVAPPEEPTVRTCTAAPDEMPVRAMLAYYATNARSPAALPRERPLPTDPYLMMQQAIQLGQARPPELVRALNLLEGVMKSSHPSAVNLSPLARALHEQYGERLRLEQQLREAQRRGEQLQEKIDALSAIERSLPTRTSPQPLPRGLQETPR